MTNTDLREALHDVASVGVGRVDDSRLSRMADRARGGGDDVPMASRGGGRRRWVVGGLAVAAVAVLVAVGVAQALQPVPVTPASGPGSLPDQIFPTREHILTLEQAPIGRVSMVYKGAATDDGRTWIAVGADSDQYRWVGQQQDECSNCGAGNLDVSADGTLVALGLESRNYQTFAVQLTSAETGEVTVVPLETPEKLGGEILGLRLSPSGDRLAVLTAVIVKDLGPGAHRWEQRLYVIDTPFDGSPAATNAIPIDGLFDTFLVGWTADEDPVISRNLKGENSGARLEVVTVDGVTTVGRVDTDSEGVSPFALSPDGGSIAVLRDPTPSASGDGKPWSLQVFDTTSGALLWERLGLNEDSSEVIGWTPDGAPVLSILHWEERASNRAGVSAGLEVYRADGEPEVLVTSGTGDRYGNYFGSRTAADVLAGGEVRDAKPPNQPWYDLRTLGPTMRDWIGDHPYSAFLLLVTAASAASGIIQFSRRRREARSRSSA